jgi:hypothetical protein
MGGITLGVVIADYARDKQISDGLMKLKGYLPLEKPRPGEQQVPPDPNNPNTNPFLCNDFDPCTYDITMPGPSCEHRDRPQGWNCSLEDRCMAFSPLKFCIDGICQSADPNPFICPGICRNDSECSLDLFPALRRPVLDVPPMFFDCVSVGQAQFFPQNYSFCVLSIGNYAGTEEMFFNNTLTDLDIAYDRECYQTQCSVGSSGFTTCSIFHRCSLPAAIQLNVTALVASKHAQQAAAA